MFSLDDIRSWPSSRIYEEIKDQKQWMRETRGVSRGFDMSAANEYLSRLYSVLNERRRSCY